MNKKLLTLIFGMVFLFMTMLSVVSSNQIKWDNDTDIEIYDIWENSSGNPLQNANCTWYVYNSNYSINQSGEISSFSKKGMMHFTVNQLSKTGIYPLLINCSKNGYYGVSTKDSIKIVDDLSEDYNSKLNQINETTKEINETTKEINETTYDIKNYLYENVNESLSEIKNTTNLTYTKVVSMNEQLSENYERIISNKEYLKSKWGKEDADEVIDRLKNINTDISYIKTRYDSLSPKEINQLLKSIKKDSRNITKILYEDGFDWEKTLKIIVPVGFILLLIFIVSIVNKSRKKKNG